MKYDREIHHRRSIRRPGYDYSTACAYFLTFCSRWRENIFAEIDGSGRVKPSILGSIVEKNWLTIPFDFKSVELDEYVIMPNHLHGILVFKNIDADGGSVEQRQGNREGCPYSPRRGAPGGCPNAACNE